MSSDDVTPDGTSNSPTDPPPFPSLDGAGYVAPIPANIDDLLNATPSIPEPTTAPTPPPVTPLNAETTTPAWETPTPSTTPAETPTTAATATHTAPRSGNRPELYDLADNKKTNRKIRKQKNTALGERRIKPLTVLLAIALIGMFAAFGYFIYYLFAVVGGGAGNGNPTFTTTTGQTTFHYPDTMPAGLGGQTLTNNPADAATLQLFADQANAAGNPRAFAEFYGPTPKVEGVSYLVYGAEMTPDEKAAVAAVGPIKDYVNQTSADYVGRGAKPLSPEPQAVPGPYGGTTWCQTAELTGAPQGTYCYWSDGTYYVAVARTAGPEGATEFTNKVVQELGLQPATQQ